MGSKTSEMMEGTNKINAKLAFEDLTRCRHEWVDDGMFTLVCVNCGIEEVIVPIDDQWE